MQHLLSKCGEVMFYHIYFGNLPQNNLNNEDQFWLYGDVQTFWWYWRKSSSLRESFYLLILLNAVRMPFALTEPFYADAFTDEIYPDTDTDDKNSPNVI